MAKSCIENMRELSWGDGPYQLLLKESEQPFICDDIVRIVPGKRMVAFGKWGDKQVVAKLFYGSRKAKQQADRDRQGVQALIEAGVPTPALCNQCSSQDNRVEVLFFEKISNAVSFQEIWQKQEDSESIHKLLPQLTIELATQHVLGIVQHDLHFKNFLVSGEKIYTLDGSDVEQFEGTLDKNESIKNLALFLAQLGSHAKNYRDKLFQIYADARGWRLKTADCQLLQTHISNYQKIRWMRFQKKIFRDCSAFKKIKNSRMFAMIDRQYESEEFRAFIKQPDKLFSEADVQYLKEGNTSTVIKTFIDGREYVIKRYNVKNFWHGLRRCFRATRAATSWRLAQYLCLMGVPTAKPVAFIEKRFLGLRMKSYFIMEPIDGEHIGYFYAQVSRKYEDKKNMADKIILLINQLAELKLTHGDLKMTNILIHHDEPFLIDLDGMREHRCTHGFKRAFDREWKRFLANWKDRPTVYKLFLDTLARD